jgi:hypothetical protein
MLLLCAGKKFLKNLSWKKIVVAVSKHKFTILGLLALSLLFIEDKDLFVVLLIGSMIAIIYSFVRNKLH